ncbi:MAG TPA: hypothetical protein VGW38_01335, partial [Chloroflexota bacterium]|nr:hypothetical protein [Chloroflexota bacterium]
MVPYGVSFAKGWLRRAYLAAWVAVFKTAAALARGTAHSSPLLQGEREQTVRMQQVGDMSTLPSPSGEGLGVRSSSRILVIRLGLLGDGVLLTPTLRLLRQSFPKAEVHVLATPIQTPLLSPLPTVDRVLAWEAGDLLEPRLALQPWRWLAAARMVREIRRQRYDVALACYGPLASALALLSGAPTRAGYAGEALPGTLTHVIPGARWEHPWHDAEY